MVQKINRFVKQLANSTVQIYQYNDPKGFPITYYNQTFQNGDKLDFVQLWLLPTFQTKYLALTKKDGSKAIAIEYAVKGQKPVVYTKILNNKEPFQFLNQIQDGLQEYIVDPVTSAFDTVEYTVKESVDYVVAPIKQAADTVIDGISKAKDDISQFVTYTIPSTFTNVTNTIQDFAEDSFGTVKAEVVGLVNTVQGLDIPGNFMNIVNQAKDVGETVGSYVYDNLSTGFGYVKDGVTLAFDKTKDGVMLTKDYAVQYGKIIGDNLQYIAEKIGDGFYMIGAEVKQQGEMVIDQIRGNSGPILDTSKSIMTGIYKILSFFANLLLGMLRFISSSKGVIIFKALFILFILLTPLMIWGTYNTVKKGITGKSEITGLIQKA